MNGSYRLWVIFGFISDKLLALNTKIGIGAIMALIITFSVLAIAKNTLENDFKKMDAIISNENDDASFLTNEEFFATDFSNQRTVFLLGSSHVGHINVTKVSDLISLNDSITIYNLATGSDTPVERIKSIDQIISAKPEIVFYGISYRDFSFPYQNTAVRILPDPQQIIFSQIESYFDDVFPSNPQWLTRNILNKILKTTHEKESEQQSEKFMELNTPFYEYYKNTTIAEDFDLKKLTTSAMTWNDANTKDRNIHAINEIISKFHKHKVKVVLFTTPLHEYYLKSLSNSQKNQFSLLKNELTENHGIKIYEFEEKYHGLDIWSDLSHVSYHRNVTAYNIDIAKMISAEIEK